MSGNLRKSIEQVLQDEQAGLMFALEEQVTQYRQSVACSIQKLVIDSSESNQSPETVWQNYHSTDGRASEVLDGAGVFENGCKGSIEPRESVADHSACYPGEESEGVMTYECSGSDARLPSTEPKMPHSEQNAGPVDQLNSVLEVTAPRHAKHDLASLLGTLSGGSAVLWTNHEQQMPSSSRFERFVRGSTFDLISSMLIVGCACTMAIEVQYDGMQAGYVLGRPGFQEPASQKWPYVAEILSISDMTFNILFSIELGLRIAALRLDAFRSCWFYFDAVLVTTSFIFHFHSDDISLINPMILRLVRITRLGRMLKLLRNATIVQTLFLLVRSIEASVGCLLWSFSVIWFFQVLMAILVSQILQPVMMDDSKDKELRTKLFKYFGTTTHAILTMFEITLGNWVPTCRMLYENVSEVFGAFYILYRCCFMFAIIKIITAVFVAETTRCVASDDALALQKKQKQGSVYLAKLAEIFRHLDVNGDGVISWEEFEPLITNPVLKTWLATLDIDTHDLNALFQIYARGDGLFDINCFIDGMSHIKGPAKSIDVLKLLENLNDVKRMVKTLMEIGGTCTRV